MQYDPPQFPKGSQFDSHWYLIFPPTRYLAKKSDNFYGYDPYPDTFYLPLPGYIPLEEQR